MDQTADFYILTDMMPVREALEVTKLVEDLGYKRAWVPEDTSRDAFASLGAMAVSTRRIELGSDIVSVFIRTPLSIAMSANVIDELSDSRFILGIGTGGEGFITLSHGVPFSSPVDRVREYIQVLRSIFKGERFSFQGKYVNIRNFRMRGKPVREDVPIYISALNPKMIQLAGEMADGMILSHLALDYMDEVRHNLELGASRSGRRVSDVKIFSNMPASLEDEESREALRRIIAFHLAATTYHRMLAAAGFKSEAKQVMELWNAGKLDEAAKLVTDDMVGAVSLGSGSGVRKNIARYQSKGVQPIIFTAPRKGRAQEDLMDMARLAAR